MSELDRTEIVSEALAEIQDLRVALEAAQRARNEPVAIVGMSCRFPGAANPEAFWELLRDGRDAVTDIPPGRWDIDGFYDPDPKAPGKMYTRRGAFLDDIEGFDAPFFGVSPREAAELDPQQRLLLEVSWEALEHAGQAVDRLAGTRTGVFVGVTGFDYVQNMMLRYQPDELDAYLLTGNIAAFAAGRLSYWLGLQGPSLTVDTACSSSLVAVHLACQSLRAGDCTMALAGGSNVLLSPEWFVVLSKANMMAADGRCKTFDAAADGYVRGEGCGVVALKLLSDAIADNDRVLAVIRGSSVNQDGRSSGITVPNGQSQQAVIRQALRDAGIDGSRVGYVEAHGTGTALGDPIEVNALTKVLGMDRADRFAIGSVKTNIGHLEPAAGVAGLIKTVLALHHEALPPLLHLTEVNPDIPVGELPITIPTTLTPWPRQQQPRIAGVSSFGASGTNAHVIVEEAPEPNSEEVSVERPAHLLTLSARTEEALAALATRYAEHDADSLADLAFTANHGRAQFGHRLAVQADSPQRLREKLTAHLIGSSDVDIQAGVAKPGARPKVAFLFTGQGSQYAGMGRELYETQPGFRADLDHCDEVLREPLGRSLLSLIFPEPGAESLINETRYTQPALFALQYALARLWDAWGVRPAAMLGHSVGEYAAACVAGVFSVEDGLALIAERARLMQELPTGGGMAAILTGADRVIDAIEPYRAELAIAAINGPQNTVVSGATRALGAVLERFAADGVPVKPLAVSHAFHSPAIEPMLDEFERLATKIPFATSRVPLVSNLTGEPIDELSAGYLRDHARQPVRFMDGLRALAERGCQAFLEIGPAPVLCGMATHTLAEQAYTWLPSLRRGHGDWQTMLRGLGALYVAGCDVDWAGFDRDYPRRRVDAPTYPFQRRRHWFQAAGTPRREVAEPVAVIESHSLLGRRIPSPLAQFQSTLTVEAHPGLGDCVFDGKAFVNAGFYLEAAMAAARELHGLDHVRVDNLVMPRALIMPEQGGQTVALIAEPAPNGTRFSYHSQRSETGWELHAKGSFASAGEDAGGEALEEILPRCPTEMSGDEFYRYMWNRRFYFGPSARWHERILRGQREAISWMRAAGPEEAGQYRLHPGIVDAALQLLSVCTPEGLGKDDALILVELESFSCYGHDGEALLCHAVLRESMAADIRLFTGDGRPVATMRGVHMKQTRRETLLRAVDTAPPAPRPASPVVHTGHKEDLRGLLVSHSAAVLGATSNEIDVHEPLRDLGLDSLLAVELRDSVTRDLGVDLGAAPFLDNPSIISLEATLLPLLDFSSPVAVRLERSGPGGMSVVEVGSGPPIVFVHGGATAGGTESWETQLSLADRWRLIIPSRLNYGSSPGSEREDFEADAALIAELVGDGAHLVGQSYGAVGAMLAAALRPDAVWSLTLVESGASAAARGIAEVDEYERGARELVEAPDGDPEELFRSLFALIDPAARSPAALPPALRAFADRMRTGIRWPWEAEIPEVRVPTLVVSGGERPVFEAISDALAERLRGERLVIAGGHATQNTGSAFNTALEAFLSRVPAVNA